jgi:hypothetical protein
MTDKATLTDATGLGGLIAQGGFDYQLFDALTRLPAWLADAAFEGFGIEMLEDVEARFVAPHTTQGHVIDRYQAKSAQLTRGGLVDVFKGFQKFAADYPQTTRAQILVTPALPPTEAYLSRDPGRVRRARPFYAPFAGIQAASDEKLQSDLVDDLGDSLGPFFADNVEVALQPMVDRGQAEAQFAASLHAAFPDLELGPSAAARVFADLLDYSNARRGGWLKKADLLAVIRNAAGRDPSVPGDLPVHVRSDRNGSDPRAIEIDASAFSGGATGYPPPETWSSELLTPLDRLHRWARATGHQRIDLSGSYRLTTAFALGWAFRSAVGFDIDIPTRQGSWSTDDRAEPEQAPAWTITRPETLVGDHLVVCIGSVRDPTADVRKQLGLAETPSVLSAVLPGPVTDAKAAQASVRLVRGAIEVATKALRPAAIDLYIAGPAALFVALGHRWNAMPTTQLHEFLADRRVYVPSARIPV